MDFVWYLEGRSFICGVFVWSIGGCKYFLDFFKRVILNLGLGKFLGVLVLYVIV